MSENVIIDIIVAVFVVLGSIISLVTMVGLIRLPDTYTRAHAASKSATLVEIAVLGIAAIGIYAMIKGSIKEEEL